MPWVPAGPEAGLSNPQSALALAGDLSPLCAHLTCDVTTVLLSRKSGRAVLQQQLYYVQPRGGADDWGAGDRPGAEL